MPSPIKPLVMSVPTSTSVIASPVLIPVLSAADSVVREAKVRPPPRLPSEPNLTRQFGDPKPDHDYTVYLPLKQSSADAGPTYSNLNPARRRSTG